MSMNQCEKLDPSTASAGWPTVLPSHLITFPPLPSAVVPYPSNFPNAPVGQFSKAPVIPQGIPSSSCNRSSTTGQQLNVQFMRSNGFPDLAALVSNYGPVHRSPKTKLNVSTVSALLSNYKSLALSVERSLNYLEVTKKTISEEAWNEKCEALEEKKALLLEAKQQIEDPHFVRLLHQTVTSVRKKRKRLSKKRREWQRQKEEMAEVRQEKHKQIDLWLEKMQDQVERARREEMVKNEADLVLSDVYRKKNEGKRVLGLLNSLKKLRNAEELRRSSSATSVSQGNTSTFHEVIDKLKDMWAAQMNEYNKEEQGLKVMMDDVAVQRVNNEEKSWKSILNQWTETFFGGKSLVDSLQAQPSDGDRFVLVRRDWDQFISDGNTLLSSSIPPGYVVPCKPSSEAWSELLAEFT